MLALLSGVLGSFMHAAQSFTAYVGNRTIRRSWLLWYFVRPPIGAVMGMVFYFVIRAGLVGGSSDSVSPYGVVAFAGLAGWFSKQATEKLAEVFETLFDTSDRERHYHDKLEEHPERPKIERVTVSERGSDADDLVLRISGEHFEEGVVVMVGDDRLPAKFASNTEICASVPPDKLPLDASELAISVQNPGPQSVPSETVRINLAADPAGSSVAPPPAA